MQLQLVTSSPHAWNKLSRLCAAKKRMKNVVIENENPISWILPSIDMHNLKAANFQCRTTSHTNVVLCSAVCLLSRKKITNEWMRETNNNDNNNNIETWDHYELRKWRKANEKKNHHWIPLRLISKADRRVASLSRREICHQIDPLSTRKLKLKANPNIQTTHFCDSFSSTHSTYM